MASASVAKAAVESAPVERLICATLRTFASRVRPGVRIAGMDVTDSHISLALSDVSHRDAMPFGLLARTGDTKIDSRILQSAMKRAAELEQAPIDVCAIVVGAPPGSPPVQYLLQLLNNDQLFPALDSIMFYREAHVVTRAVNAQFDTQRAIELLPPNLENKKRKVHATAMNPKVSVEQLRTDRESRASVSATEILQAALDDISQLDLS